MSETDERYSRQVRLSEVGLEGQRKLIRQSFALGEHAGAPIAREYLLRAGARSVVPGDAASSPFIHADHFHHAACREFAQGAWTALDRIRRTLVL